MKKWLSILTIVIGVSCLNVHAASLVLRHYYINDCSWKITLYRGQSMLATQTIDTAVPAAQNIVMTNDLRNGDVVEITRTIAQGSGAGVVSKKYRLQHMDTVKRLILSFECRYAGATMRCLHDLYVELTTSSRETPARMPWYMPEQ